MSAYVCIQYYEQNKPTVSSGGASVLGAVVGLGAMLLGVGAGVHGYVVGATGTVTQASGAPGKGWRSVLWSFVKKVLGVCFLASMIGVGEYIYVHFAKKWESEGLPSVPIMALGKQGLPNQPGPTIGQPAMLGGPAGPPGQARPGQQPLKYDMYTD